MTELEAVTSMRVQFRLFESILVDTSQIYIGGRRRKACQSLNCLHCNCEQLSQTRHKIRTLTWIFTFPWISWGGFASSEADRLSGTAVWGSRSVTTSGKPPFYFLLLFMLLWVKKVNFQKVQTTFEKPSPPLFTYFFVLFYDNSTFCIIFLYFSTMTLCFHTGSLSMIAHR